MIIKEKKTDYTLLGMILILIILIMTSCTDYKILNKKEYFIVKEIKDRTNITENCIYTLKYYKTNGVSHASYVSIYLPHCNFEVGDTLILVKK